MTRNVIRRSVFLLLTLSTILFTDCAFSKQAVAVDLSFIPGEGPLEKQANHLVNEMMNERRFLLDGILQLEALHARVDDATSRIFIGQMLGMFETFAGDYEAAAHYCGVNSGMHPGGIPAGGVSQPARDALAEMARHQSAMLLNESHCDPVGRGLVLELLPELAKAGYRNLALETLTLADDENASKGKGPLPLKDRNLQRRGYPLDVTSTGVYTREPLMGEIVRSALKMHMSVFGYDDADADGVDRERAQANRLVAIRKSIADGKLVVLGGLGHMMRSPSKQMMAWWLGQTDFGAFTAVDQTNANIPAIDIGAGNPARETYTVVLHDGAAWSADPAAFDVTVLTNERSSAGGRPAWLGLDGMRKRVSIAGRLCQGRVPCLIEARYAGESSHAVPADRFILRSQEQSSYLYLRQGDYLLAAFDRQGERRAHYRVRVL